MQRKRRDNRTLMQRKADQSSAIAAFCLFFCAVLAFCASVCKITAPKLKPQESALKREIAVCDESKEKYVDGSLPGDDTPATLCAYIEYDIPAYNLSDADRETLWHIVQGEAGGESYDGKLWVATCLLNAMRKNDMSAEEVRGLILETQRMILYYGFTRRNGATANGTKVNSLSQKLVNTVSLARGRDRIEKEQRKNKKML